MERQAALRAFASNEDKLLCGRVMDLAQAAAARSSQTFTDFMDPARAAKFLSLFGREGDAAITAFGGFAGAERQMLGFCAPYDAPCEAAFPIAPVRVGFEAKFAAVRHQDVLGAILGLGVDRAKIGDIVLKEGAATVFAEASIAAFVAGSLTKVGRAGVSAELLDDASGVFAPIPIEETRLSVRSARVDALAAAAFRLSRGEAAELAAKGRLFLNWAQTSGSKPAEAGDTVTARGFGRFKVMEINATKKDRLSVTISRS